MIGLNTEGFSAHDVLQEMKEVIREQAKAPESRDRRRRVKDRMDQIAHALETSGIPADGTTLIALVQMGQQSQQIAEQAIETETFIKNLLKVVGAEEVTGE